MCEVESGLALPNRCFPTRGALALLDGIDTKKLFDVPHCLLDPWTETWLNTHVNDEDGVKGAIPQHRLRLRLMLEKRTIGRLECINASLRRRIYKRGVQTHGESFADLSAEFACAQVARGEHRYSANAVGKAGGTLASWRSILARSSCV